MYFDLEYVPTCNPLVDGDMMVTILLNLVRMGVRCAPLLNQRAPAPAHLSSLYLHTYRPSNSKRG
jgi:hypothetical protein